MADSSNSWIFLNDRWVPQDAACLSVLDRGFLYGDGVFETLRAYEGRVVWLDRHLARLHRSCERLQISPPVPFAAWPSLLAELLARNHLTDALIRITISRGSGEWGLDPSPGLRPTVVVMAKAYTPYPSRLKEHGVRLEVATVRRHDPAAQPPDVKSISFLNNILAKQEALNSGAFDALMLNRDDVVTECTVSNIFFVDEEVLYTPSRECGILEGITRGVIIELARVHGQPVQEGHYPLARLMRAQECFLTNTSMEMMPVRQIGEQPIGSVCPGPITQRLQGLFAMEVCRYLATPPERTGVRESD